MPLSACHPPPPAHKWASRNPAGETLHAGLEAKAVQELGLPAGVGDVPTYSWRFLL